MTEAGCGGRRRVLGGIGEEGGQQCFWPMVLPILTALVRASNVTPILQAHGQRERVWDTCLSDLLTSLPLSSTSHHSGAKRAGSCLNDISLFPDSNVRAVFFVHSKSALLNGDERDLEKSLTENLAFKIVALLHNPILHVRNWKLPPYVFFSIPQEQMLA